MFNFLVDMHFDFDMKIVEFFNNLTDIKFFEILFKGISYIGTEYACILVFGVLYWCIDKNAAKRIGYPAFFSMIINGFVKGFVNRPRPFQQYPDKIICRDESILSVDTNNEYIPKDFGYGMSLRSNSTSFPSGHSQNTSSLFYSVFAFYKKKWLLITWITFSVLVMISRMALGVHFFTDVLTGYLLGIICIHGYNEIIKKVKNINKFHIILLLLMGAFTLLSPIWSDEAKDSFSIYGVMVGLVLGSILEEKNINFEFTNNKLNNFLRFVFGILIVVLIKILFKLTYSWAFDEGTYLRDVFDMIRYFLMSFIGIGIYPMLFKKVKFLK